MVGCIHECGGKMGATKCGNWREPILLDDFGVFLRLALHWERIDYRIEKKNAQRGGRGS